MLKEIIFFCCILPIMLVGLANAAYRFTDCSYESYKEISDIRERYPEMSYKINLCIEDKTLSWIEYDVLKREAARLECNRLYFNLPEKWKGHQ